MSRTREMNSSSRDPRSRSMASFTVRLVVNGPGVKSRLSVGTMEELDEAFLHFVRLDRGPAQVFGRARTQLDVKQGRARGLSQMPDGSTHLGRIVSGDGLPVIGRCRDLGETHHTGSRALSTRGIVRFVIQQDVQQIRGLIVTHGRE